MFYYSLYCDFLYCLLWCKKYLLTIIFPTFLSILLAEDSNHTSIENYSKTNDIIPSISTQMITGWADFKLGNSYDEIAKLLEEVDFIELVPAEPLYHEEVKIEFEKTINIVKNDFFDRLQMHFTTNKRLYSIQMKLSKNLFSFNEIYKRLKEKYGPAQIVRFRRVTWSNATRKLILSRDNTVKYLAIDQFPLYTNSASFLINQEAENIKDNIFQRM